MTLTTIILLVLVPYVAQIFLQKTPRFGFDLWGIVGNRDNLPEESVVAARLDRDKNNVLEAFPIFLALALLALVKGSDMSKVVHAASIFLIARIAYVPAYVSVVTTLQSLVWSGGCQPCDDGAAPCLGGK